MNRVLVTGARGFIGRHCLPELVARGYEVFAVTSQANRPTDGEVRWVKADLFDQEQTERICEWLRPTHLLHLAWIATPGVFWNSSDNLRWLEASMFLLNAFIANRGGRVVIAGTCAEYDWSDGYCREDVTPLRPATVYGKCKHALQLFTSCLAQQSELSAAWARLFFLYGPHAPTEKFPGFVIDSLVQRKPAACSEGLQLRDFLHVQDAADALVELLDSDVRNAINIASGVPVRLKDMAVKVAAMLGRPELLRIGEFPSKRHEPPMLAADVGRLRHELNWSPRFDLDRGLADTINWWKRNSRVDVAA